MGRIWRGGCLCSRWAVRGAGLEGHEGLPWDSGVQSGRRWCVEGCQGQQESGRFRLPCSPQDPLPTEIPDGARDPQAWSRWPFPRSALWSDWGDSTREPEVDKLERVEAVWLAPVHLSPDNNHLALRWHWDIGPSSGGRDNDLEAEHVVLAVLFIPDITKA